eukprot:Gb_16210 [translate_table: standard]
MFPSSCPKLPCGGDCPHVPWQASFHVRSFLFHVALTFHVSLSRLASTLVCSLPYVPSFHMEAIVLASHGKRPILLGPFYVISSTSFMYPYPTLPLVCSLVPSCYMEVTILVYYGGCFILSAPFVLSYPCPALPCVCSFGYVVFGR